MWALVLGLALASPEVTDSDLDQTAKEFLRACESREGITISPGTVMVDGKPTHPYSVQVQTPDGQVHSVSCEGLGAPLYKEEVDATRASLREGCAHHSTMTPFQQSVEQLMLQTEEITKQEACNRGDNYFGDGIIARSAGSCASGLGCEALRMLTQAIEYPSGFGGKGPITRIGELLGDPIENYPCANPKNPTCIKNLIVGFVEGLFQSATAVYNLGKWAAMGAYNWFFGSEEVQAVENSTEDAALAASTQSPKQVKTWSESAWDWLQWTLQGALNAMTNTIKWTFGCEKRKGMTCEKYVDGFECVTCTKMIHSLCSAMGSTLPAQLAITFTGGAALGASPTLMAYAAKVATAIKGSKVAMAAAAVLQSQPIKMSFQTLNYLRGMTSGMAKAHGALMNKTFQAGMGKKGSEQWATLMASAAKKGAAPGAANSSRPNLSSDPTADNLGAKRIMLKEVKVGDEVAVAGIPGRKEMVLGNGVVESVAVGKRGQVIANIRVPASNGFRETTVNLNQNAPVYTPLNGRRAIMVGEHIEEFRGFRMPVTGISRSGQLEFQHTGVGSVARWPAEVPNLPRRGQQVFVQPSPKGPIQRGQVQRVSGDQTVVKTPSGPERVPTAAVGKTPSQAQVAVSDGQGGIRWVEREAKGVYTTPAPPKPRILTSEGPKHGSYSKTVQIDEPDLDITQPMPKMIPPPAPRVEPARLGGSSLGSARLSRPAPPANSQAPAAKLGESATLGQSRLGAPTRVPPRVREGLKEDLKAGLGLAGQTRTHYRTPQQPSPSNPPVRVMELKPAPRFSLSRSYGNNASPTRVTLDSSALNERQRVLIDQVNRGERVLPRSTPSQLEAKAAQSVGIKLPPPRTRDQRDFYVNTVRETRGDLREVMPRAPRADQGTYRPNIDDTKELYRDFRVVRDRVSNNFSDHRKLEHFLYDQRGFNYTASADVKDYFRRLFKFIEQQKGPKLSINQYEALYHAHRTRAEQALDFLESQAQRRLGQVR